MALEVEDRRLPRLLVERGIEHDAVTPGDACVPLGRELGSGTAEREVDVEEDRPDRRHATSSSQRTVCRCVGWYSLSNPHAMVCPIVQPRARSRSRPRSEVTLSRRYSASRLL